MLLKAEIQEGASSQKGNVMRSEPRKSPFKRKRGAWGLKKKINTK